MQMITTGIEDDQERIIAYDGDIEPNNVLEINITCKITKTNLYLQNLENTVTIDNISNGSGSSATPSSS